MNVVAFGKLLREQRKARSLSIQGLVQELRSSNIQIEAKYLELWEDFANENGIKAATKRLVESWKDEGATPSYEVVEYLIDYFQIDPVYFYIIVLNSGLNAREENPEARSVDAFFSYNVINRYLKLCRLQAGLSVNQVAKELWNSGVYITEAILLRFEEGLGPELPGATICAIGEAIDIRHEVMRILNYAAIKAISKSPEECQKRFSRIARLINRDIEKYEDFPQRKLKLTTFLIKT